MERTQSQAKPKNTLVIYITGFALSLVLTLVAYFLTQRHVSSKHEAISHGLLVFMITALAIIQLLVQLVFFLHLDEEKRPHWNLTVAIFAAFFLILLVFGSLWVMHNLDYNMKSPSDINKYIRSQSDL